MDRGSHDGLEQDMLDATMRAHQRRVENVTPALADASGRFPYNDATFDAAYLNGVLGEIPSQRQALLDLRRVLIWGGGATRCRRGRLWREGARLAYFARFVAT